jgi:hypothetical protein
MPPIPAETASRVVALTYGKPPGEATPGAGHDRSGCHLAALGAAHLGLITSQILWCSGGAIVEIAIAVATLG